MTKVSSLPAGNGPSSGTGSGVLFLSRFFRYVERAASTVAECLRDDDVFAGFLTALFFAVLATFFAGAFVVVFRAGTRYPYPTARGTPTRPSTPSEKCTTGSPSGAGSRAAVSRLSCRRVTRARRNGQGGCSARVYQSRPRWCAQSTNRAVR